MGLLNSPPAFLHPGLHFPFSLFPLNLGVQGFHALSPPLPVEEEKHAVQSQLFLSGHKTAVRLVFEDLGFGNYGMI